MNRTLSTKLIAAAAVALGALGLSQAAQARTDVTLAIGIPAYVEPAPVYVAPQAYVEPAPVYVQPRGVYYESAPRYVSPRYAAEREYRRAEWRRWHRGHERHDPAYYGYYANY